MQRDKAFFLEKLISHFSFALNLNIAILRKSNLLQYSCATLTVCVIKFNDKIQDYSDHWLLLVFVFFYTIYFNHIRNRVLKK